MSSNTPPHEIRFERTALYEEVWAKPMRTLAQQYGMSDNGLRKVCRALNIPLPEQGHWAKVAAGHRVRQTPLPAQTGRTTFISNPPGQQPLDLERAAERAVLKQKAAARQEANVALTFDPPARLHRVLQPYAQQLRASVKEYEKALHKHLQPPKQSRTWEPQLHLLGSSFDSWTERGLELGYREQIPLRVTPATCERALQIMNAVLMHVASSRMTIEPAAKRARISVGSAGATVYIRIAELFDVVEVKPVGLLNRSRQYQGTGTLRLFISHDVTGSSHYLTESADHRFEARSEEILQLLDRQLGAGRIAELERQERERRWKEERERAEAERQRRERERQRLQAERERREELQNEAEHWARAETLRRYADRLESGSATYSDEPAQRAATFVEELRQAAEFVDPTVMRLRSFTDQSEVEIPKRTDSTR